MSKRDAELHCVVCHLSPSPPPLTSFVLLVFLGTAAAIILIIRMQTPHSSGPAGISSSQCTSSCTTLYGGHNVFASVDGNTLQYTLTDPSDSSVLSDEAIAWSGDSGGPAFISGKIAGVNSGGDCCGYGSVDQYVRVGSNLSTTWIAESISSEEAADPGDCSDWIVTPPGEGEDSSAAPSVATGGLNAIVVSSASVVGLTMAWHLPI